MKVTYLIALIWLGLAVLSAIIAYHIKISIAVVEICINRYSGYGPLGNIHCLQVQKGI